MAVEYRQFEVSVPAGTAKASPQVVNLVMPSRIVRSIRWRVPPGPMGLLGWRLTSGGEAVIPANAGEYLVADNESDTLAPEGTIQTGAWQLMGYNTGLYAHTVYLTFGLDPVGVAVADTLAAPLAL